VNTPAAVTREQSFPAQPGETLTRQAVCGLLTLALNTAGSIADRQYGTALVDAVGPALLMGWRGRPLDAPPDPRRLPGCQQRRRAERRG
jgi:hypothetical protein